ncbi:helix-turn-helix transcriptional regulator [Demequina rhizosphaerae]|uniref:helix-turn-helix transcriptional regulator n=1 Tax=Demequina rhizosphaerae TaxID=1638985 RepID=UPI00078535D8|nr:WYL domain-containing protein [Demequina rhizosphaerae]
MAEQATDRLVRMLGILTYVERNGDTPFAELAEHFGVTVEQVRADLNALWVASEPGDSWFPIDFSADAYDADIAALVRNDGVSQVRLSPREAVALVGALSTMGAAGALPEAGTQVLDKLRDALQEPVTVLGDDHVQPEIREPLLEAMRRYRLAEVEYVDAQDRRTTRVVDPHRLVVIDGHAYLECFCRRAEDYRVLRLDRIASVAVLGAAVEHPPTDTAGFTLTPAFRATVRIARSGRYALEDMPGVTIEDAEEDVIATFDVADAAFVAGRLLSVAPHLREVTPNRLVDELHRQARSVLDVQG